MNKKEATSADGIEPPDCDNEDCEWDGTERRWFHANDCDLAEDAPLPPLTSEMLNRRADRHPSSFLAHLMGRKVEPVE